MVSRHLLCTSCVCTKKQPHFPRYDDDGDATTGCVACGVGYQTDQSSGAVQCVPCARGRFDHDANSTTECQECSAGSVTDTLSTCTRCATGRFSPSPEQDCTACPANASSLNGSTSILDCFCIAGHYNPNPHPKTACLLCPAGSTTDKLSGTGGTSCAACEAGECPGGRLQPSSTRAPDYNLAATCTRVFCGKRRGSVRVMLHIQLHIHGRPVSLNTFQPSRDPSTSYRCHSAGAGGANHRWDLC